MKEPVAIRFPFGGNSDAESFTDQAPGTSRECLNVRGIDSRTGRQRGSRRAPLQKKLSVAINTATKVSTLFQVAVDTPRISWASNAAGSEETRWSTTTPTRTDTLGVACDRQSNVYAIDGNSGIVKYNSDGVQVFKHPLPIDHPDHIVRALWVDADDRVYAAVSAGGDQAKAKAWCYQLGEDNAVMPLELVWELKTGAYIERMKVRADKLYVLENRPDRGRTAIVAYTNIDTSDPVEAFRRPGVSFPGNDLDIGPDGSIFVASEPNATRGFDPKVPDTTPGGIDWTPLDLTDKDRRIWSWHDASDPDAFAIDRLSGADDDEGGRIQVWYDKSGRSRHWFASTLTGAKPPTFRSLGVGGFPSVHFDGATSAMESALPTSTEKAQKSDQLCTIPNYSGAQFALFIVFRAPIEAVVRWLVGFDGTGGAAVPDRAIMVNREPGAALPGVAVAGELTLYEEECVAGTAAASTTVPGAPTNLHPAAGSVGSNGMTVVTWICDGGVHDVFGTATRSTLRVNGWPIDRWQSREFRASVAARLGYAAQAGATGFFSGDIAEMIVLSDWESPTNVSQRLLTVPEYPDVAWAGASDTECERIEGYLANKWRCADQLPGGQAAVLTMTALPLAATTVSLGAVYTYAAAPVFPAMLTVARQVAIGATVAETLSNLRHAVNRTGRPGIEYGSSTVADTAYRALSPQLAEPAGGSRMWATQRDPYQAAIGVATTAVGSAWNPGVTSPVVAGTIGGNNTFSPHPFFNKRFGIATVTYSVGGPPRAAGAATMSQALLQNYAAGILAKFDATNGKLKWVATSDYTGDGTIGGVGVGVGAVGYGVLIASTGHVFSTGPRQAASAIPVVTTDTVEVRKYGDTGTTFIVSSLPEHDAWQVLVGIQTNHYPRMALDKFDNLYVPIFQSSPTTSAIVYSKASAALNQVAVALVTLNNITSDPQAYAIAVDPNPPTFQATTPPNRAEHFYLATRNATVATFATLYKIRLVTSTLAPGSNRQLTNVAVCGGDIKTWAPPSTLATPTGGAAALDSAARYIDRAVLFGKGYLVDGKKTLVFDPTANTVTELTSEGPGVVPQFCKFVFVYGGRLGLARSASDPWNFTMSAKDKPRNWDLFPRVQTADQALAGNLSDGSGKSPDIINSFAALSDDLAIIGGDHSIHRISGNPTLLGGGRIDMVSKTIGMAWGRSWAQDSDGNFYFVGSRGGLYMIPAAAGGVAPLSEKTIPKRLSEFDFANYYVELVWDDAPTRQGLHVLQFPFGVGGTHVKHWFIEKRTGGWHEDEYGTATMTSIQPTAAFVFDGDADGDRDLVFGCEDGFLRYLEPTATNGDDGEPIESRVMMGPFTVAEGELRFTELAATFAKDMAGCRYELFASDQPDTPGLPVVSGEFQAGVNPIHFVRARGRYVWVRIQTATAGEPWALETMYMQAHHAGRPRVRS